MASALYVAVFRQPSHGRDLGIEAYYPKRNLSRPIPGHEIYPYLLRGVSTARPNQVWKHRYYVPSDAWRPPLLAASRHGLFSSGHFFCNYFPLMWCEHVPVMDSNDAHFSSTYPRTFAWLRAPIRLCAPEPNEDFRFHAV